MGPYRVNFFKNLLSSDGHQFKCLQDQVDIVGVDSEAQAAELASQRFAKLRGLSHWKLRADSIEVQCVDVR
jgi:hypothetical protein